MTSLIRKKLGWLLWLTPFLFSCENDEILSLPQEPGDQTLSLFFQEIPLDYSIVQLDSVITSRRRDDNVYRFLTGTYQNEFFGEVSATSYTELGVDRRSEIGDEDIYDSLVLTLVNDYFYGDASQINTQSVGIYPLLDTIGQVAYFRTDEIPFEAMPLGELNFLPNPKADSVADTLRIRLDDNFGQELFDLAKSDISVFQSDSAFRLFFPGIALSTTTSNNFITGFNPARLSMTLYYSTSAETEPSTFIFDVGNGQPTFNNISADRSGTPLAGLMAVDQKAVASDGGFYMQAGTGLVPTLKLDPILDFIDSLDRNTAAQLKINRVELYIGTTPLGTGQPLPQQVLALSFEEDFSITLDTITDQIGRTTFPPRGLQVEGIRQQSDGTFPIQPFEERYQILITRYIQNILDEVPGTETEFMIRTFRLGTRPDEIVAEPDSVFAKVFYTLLE